MTETLKCKLCGEEKPAEDVQIAPPRDEHDPSAETEKWTGPICKDCRERMKRPE